MEHEELAWSIFDGVTFPLAHRGVFKKLLFVVGLVLISIHWGSPHASLGQTIAFFAVPTAEEKYHLPRALAFSNLLKVQRTFRVWECASNR
jgi:hypothetical protein